MSEQALFPDDWLIRQIGDIVDPNRRITYGIVQPGPRFEPEQGVPMIRGQDYSGGVVGDNDLYHVSPRLAASFDRAKVIGGDLLMSIVGYVGTVAEVPNSLSGANLTQTTARIAVKPELCGRYFLHFFRSSFFRDEVKRYMKGSAQPGLNLADVEKMTVAFPTDQAERLSIADTLDTLDTAICETEALIDKLKAVKQGLLHDLLTRGINANGQLRPPQSEAPQLYKESPLGWTPREWEALPLDAVAARGSGHTPNKDVSSYWNGGIKWVSLADSHRLDRIYIHETDKEISEIGIANSSAVLHPEGTVILSRDAGIGKSAILGCNMAVSQHFMAWRCGEKLNNLFLYFYLQREKPKFEAIAMGSTIKTIGLPFFKSYVVAVPPRREQDQVASILMETEQDLAAHEAELDKLRQQKIGLMDDLLTGRIRVTPLLESAQQPAAQTGA